VGWGKERWPAARRAAADWLSSSDNHTRKYLADCRSEEENRKKSLDIPVLKSGKPVEGVDLNDTSKLWEM
jgi:hypothetical protein